MIGHLEKKISSKEAIIGVIGMGCIGISLLDAFGRAGFSLAGYDYASNTIEMLKKRENHLNFIDMKPLFALADIKRFIFSDDPDVLKKADVVIICAPTSLDIHRTPDLSNLRAAFQTVAKHLKKDQLIVLQSSTYPGTTEEELLPIIKKSPFKVGEDIFIAYVPEVIDFGNPNYSSTQVPRIVSGITPACRKMGELLYAQLGCKIVSSPSTKVAEAAKLLQNAYRLINISFINEMKILFDQMGIDIWEVIEAAASKPFGFTPFYPGPGIGGECISIMPIYLIWQAKIKNGPTSLLERAEHVNDAMPVYVLNKIIFSMNLRGTAIKNAKILILGVCYKKDVNDTRESPALKILPLLEEMGADISYHDPYVKKITLHHCPKTHDTHLKSTALDYDALKSYDAVVILTDHSVYDWEKIVTQSQLVIDTRNAVAHVKGSKKNVVKA